MEKQYLLTERTHFMCPNMHFGILFKIKAAYEHERFLSAMDALSSAHPFLTSKTAADEEDPQKLYYKVSDRSEVIIYEKKSLSEIRSAYINISKTNWNVFEDGLLRVFVCPENDGFNVLFAAHHLLGDGRSVLQLACEFADKYVKNTDPAYAEERLIQGIKDLPEGSGLAGISRLLVNRANRQWAKENRVVSYRDYAAFVHQFAKQSPVGYESCTMRPERVSEMHRRCREKGISVNDLLMARLYMAAETNKIIIAADIRGKFRAYNKGAMGNYATALGIVYKGRGGNDYDNACEVHALVKKSLSSNRKKMLVLACYLSMTPSLIDAAAMGGLDGFESKAAKFVGTSMFGFGRQQGVSITNLGSIKNDSMESVVFVPPASPAAVQTVGVVTLNGTMQLCSSFYENVLSHTEVQKRLKMMAD
ncbi:MAG: hypothetical protein Q4F95_00965 [Oscillospiraceae bacterium]|nr:hypothetical protein [Oscillospiraceae bacterium]